MSDNTFGLGIRFIWAATRHRIGQASVREVMAGTQPTPVTTAGDTDAWLYVGPDERGREPETIAIEVWQVGAAPYLLVIHVMPTQLQGR